LIWQTNNIPRQLKNISIMKKTNFLLLVLMAISILLLAQSCGKDGAVGPQGPVGATGPTGGTGQTGPAGATGSANVIYSAWITPSSYTENTALSTVHFDASITASAITQDVLDKGTVLVYGKLDGYTPTIWPTDQVGQLPIVLTYQLSSTVYTDTWSANVTLGSIQIDFVDNLNYYTGISNLHQFRYVIIPGGVQTLGSINPKNYNQVKQAFHLPD
jgi:hypothetical protein